MAAVWFLNPTHAQLGRCGVLRNFKYDSQKFIHAISPTPASTMSSTEISTKPQNTTLSPYTFVEKSTNNQEIEKRFADVVTDSHYWRYDVNKRQKVGGDDGNKLCFKFISSGSCLRGDKCHFLHDMDARQQSMRGVCFEFLNKGKCERGADCNFKHSFQEERSMLVFIQHIQFKNGFELFNGVMLTLFRMLKF